MIKPLLSKSGTFSMSPEAEIGYPNNFVGPPSAGGGGGGGGGGNTKAGGNSLAGGEIVIVQDYEHVLKTVDRVIAQIDVQPIQVLIEAVIVSVRLDKDLDLGVNYAILDGSGKALGVVGNGSIINATAGFTPASVLAGAAAGSRQHHHQRHDGRRPDSRPRTPRPPRPEPRARWPGTPSTVLPKTPTASSTDGPATTSPVLSVPCRRWARPRCSPRRESWSSISKRAEVHLGDQLGYQTSIVSQTSTTQHRAVHEHRHAIAVAAVRLVRRNDSHGAAPRAKHGQPRCKRHPADEHLRGHDQYHGPRRHHDRHRRADGHRDRQASARDPLLDGLAVARLLCFATPRTRRRRKNWS